MILPRPPPPNNIVRIFDTIIVCAACGVQYLSREAASGEVSVGSSLMIWHRTKINRKNMEEILSLVK